LSVRDRRRPARACAASGRCYCADFTFVHHAGPIELADIGQALRTPKTKSDRTLLTA